MLISQNPDFFHLVKSRFFFISQNPDFAISQNPVSQQLSREYFRKSMSKHVRNWVRRCKQCIRFKSTQPKHGPMHIRLYNYPFRTIGIDYVGELPVSPSGNKYILTAVCPFSNFSLLCLFLIKTLPQQHVYF